MLSFFLFSCPSPKPPEPPVQACLADESWITNPSMPKEISEDESFCDFYQFSWQWFLAQTSPSETKGERVFETNRVYDPNVPKDQCDLNLIGKRAFLESLEPRTIKADKFEHVEADGGALYDQNGTILYYGVYYSKELCDATSSGFKEGSVEIKTSWMIVDENKEEFYKIKIEDGTILGLVGMHLAIWTPNHPEMIWATWEHKANAPLCNGTSQNTDWSFVSNDAASCLKANEAPKPYQVPDECKDYKFNEATKFDGSVVPLKSDPNNVCREFAFGNEYGPAINGNDTDANLKAIVELNKGLVGAEGLLSKLPKDNPMSIWSNYRLIGALWTKDGQPSGKSPVDTKAEKGDAASPQRGSLQLTNTTMETFQQGPSSYVPNCFGCHNYTTENPLQVSHIYDHLK